MDLIQMYVVKMIIHMLVATPFYIFGRWLFIKTKKMPVNPVREFIMAGFTVYMIALASQTIIPQWIMGYSDGAFYFEVQGLNQSAGVNLIPFQTIYSYTSLMNGQFYDWGTVPFLNLAGNVFLFSPIGFILPLVWKRWRSVHKIFWIGLGTTCLIEFLQYYIGRSSDIDDIILNTIGVVIGYWAFVVFEKIGFASLTRKVSA